MVGEIVAGIIVGQSGLRLVEEGPVLAVLSALGFAYLMFLSGLEINFGSVLNSQGDETENSVRRAAGNPILIGTIIFLLTLLISTLAALFMNDQGLIPDPWIIALAESLGIEIILGAFLAGVIVSLLSQEESSAFREKLDAFGYGFFIPIFFIMVGVGFDLPALLSSKSALLLVPILIGVAYLAKSGPSLLFRFNHPWRETLAAGTLLSFRLSLIIAAAAIGLDLNVITPALNSAIILIAIITVTLSPIIFNRLVRSTEPERARVIIVGCRPSGEQLLRRLRDHGLKAFFICEDKERYEISDGQTWTRAKLADTLQAAEIDQAKAVVAIE